MIRCQKCGYTNQSNARKCIKCHNTLQPEPEEEIIRSKGGDTNVDIQIKRDPWDSKMNDSGKTMRRFVPSSKPCALVAISNENDEEGRLIPIKGEAVNLNRSFLDEGNTSISRKSHANLSFKDGSWWLENVTDLKTTFIQVNKPVKLSDGDVILLGDSLYRFKESS